MKPTVPYEQFALLDIRVGRVTDVTEAATKKPTYRITIDFGPEIGTKVSCGGYRNYPKEALLGKQVVGVVNLPPKLMGPETSEVLILGVGNDAGEVFYLTPASEAPVGGPVY